MLIKTELHPVRQNLPTAVWAFFIGLLEEIILNTDEFTLYSGREHFIL